MKATDLKHANELAATNNLSRCTCSVVRDPKRNQLIVTEEVSMGAVDSSDFRKEISYHFFTDVDTSLVNPLLCEAKALATFRFLGLNDKVGTKQAVKPKVEAEAAESSDEVESETAPEKKPVPRARKPRTKAKPVEEAPVADDDDIDGGDDALGLDDDDQPEAPPVLYTKGKSDHAIHLRDLIVEKFGKDWKKDQKAVLAAKKLVLKLDQTVAVVDDGGDVLDSFKKTVRKMLEKIK